MSSAINLDDYILAPASNAQWRQAHCTQVEEWGMGLDADQFTQRECYLNKELDWGKQAFQAWVLVQRDAIDSLDIVSSVETFRRLVLLTDGRGNLMFRFTKFTPVQHRKKGFASHMMVLLHDQLSKDATLSILYSDVGDFYAKTKRRHPEPLKQVAWKVCSPKEVTWPVKVFAEPVQQDDPNTSPITWRDFSSIANRDAKMLSAEMASLAYPAFVLHPTGAQLEWIAGRARFYDSIEHPRSRRRGMPPIEIWGVQIVHAEASNWAFATWTFDTFKGIMHITRLRCSNTVHLDVILSYAASIARKYDMTTIDCWNVDEHLLNADASYRNVVRENHLPAMAWYDEGAPPVWKHNEHWSWC